MALFRQRPEGQRDGERRRRVRWAYSGFGCRGLRRSNHARRLTAASPHPRNRVESGSDAARRAALRWQECRGNEYRDRGQ